MEPASIVTALLPLGPVGLIIGILIYYLLVLHKDLKEERAGRISDAEKYRELTMELQEKVMNTCHRFADVIEALIDSGKLRNGK